MTSFFIRFQLVSFLLVHCSHVISFFVQAMLASQVNAPVSNKAKVSCYYFRIFSLFCFLLVSEMVTFLITYSKHA